MLNRARSAAIGLLRWSEKYMKTDMVYLARGGFWSIVGQVAAILSTLVLAMVISHYFPKEAYGQYKYILSIVALIGAFSLNGLGGAVFRSIAHGFDGALHEGFWKNLRWSILMFASAFAVATYYLLFGNYTLAVGILLGGCLSPLLTSGSLASTFLVAKKDFARQTIYFGIFATILPLAALILTILLTKNPLVLVAVYFLSNTFITLYLYRRVVRLYQPDLTKTDSGMLSYGKHLSAVGILNTVAGNIDQILLFHFVGPVQLAIYNFAIAIPDQIKGPLKTLDSMIQANFARRQPDEIHRGIGNKLTILFIFYAGSALLYVFFAPLIFKFLFPNYLDSVFYSQIYVLSILSFALNPAGAYLLIKKKVREQYIGNVTAALFQIITMLIGVIFWGLLGLICARIATRLFTSSLGYVLYKVSDKPQTPDPALQV